MKLQSDAESSPPKRSSPDALGKPLVQTAPRRFRWRAVIHSVGKKLDPSGNQPTVAWHLADCDNPANVEEHCDIGRHLMALRRHRASRRPLLLRNRRNQASPLSQSISPSSPPAPDLARQLNRLWRPLAKGARLTT